MWTGNALTRWKNALELASDSLALLLIDEVCQVEVRFPETSSRVDSEFGSKTSYPAGAWGSVCNFERLGVTSVEADVVCNQIFGLSTGVQIADSEFNWLHPNNGL